MLTLENIHCKSGKKTRLHAEYFEVNEGQLCGVVGPNGAGKTTLFKVISGDISCAGTRLLHGKPLSEWDPLHRARHLAVLPQASPLTFPFTAQEVVALGLTPLSISKRDAQTQIQYFMRVADCLALCHQPYPSLSGGERQRVQLARVLLQLSQAEQTPLLLLDEPTSAQDLGHQHHILALAKDLCSLKGYAVLAILHDLNQVMRYCNICTQLDQGRIVLTGAPSQVLNEESIEQYWHYRPIRIEQSMQHSVFI